MSDAILRAAMFGKPEAETERFLNKAKQMLAADEPIRLHVGFGRHPLDGFLNLDIRCRVIENDPLRGVAATFFDTCFIFPWLENGIALPDNSIDFVFHEDMYEHLTQRQQYLLLAEMRRLLKPGHFHRVNAPNLEDALVRNSDFSKGAAGVYDEWNKWHHQVVPTKQSLEEQARIVGYNKAHFNQKGGTISGVKFRERRPGGDRDQVTGNVFVDLEK